MVDVINWQKTSGNIIHDTGTVLSCTNPRDNFSGISGAINRNKNIARILIDASREDVPKIVHDINGDHVTREFSIKLESLHVNNMKHEEYVAALLEQSCRSATALYSYQLNKNPIYLQENGAYFGIPKVFVSLGGADKICKTMADSFSSHWPNHFRIKTLRLKRKIVDGVLSGFYLPDENIRQDATDMTSLQGVGVVIVDDVAWTLRSLMLAKEMLESMGAIVMGAIVIFNHYGPSWPLGIPICVSFSNIYDLKLV